MTTYILPKLACVVEFSDEKDSNFNYIARVYSPQFPMGYLHVRYTTLKEIEDTWNRLKVEFYKL